jgi:hypothetical protein
MESIKPVKKAYESPELIKHGQLKDITSQTTKDLG